MKIIIFIIFLCIHASSWAREGECMSGSALELKLKQSNGRVVFRAYRISVIGKDGFRIANENNNNW